MKLLTCSTCVYYSTCTPTKYCDLVRHKYIKRGDKMKLKNEKCTWTVDVDFDCRFHETSCNKTFQFTDDGVKENKFRYCPFCGKIIKSNKYSSISQ